MAEKEKSAPDGKKIRIKSPAAGESAEEKTVKKTVEKIVEKTVEKTVFTVEKSAKSVENTVENTEEKQTNTVEKSAKTRTKNSAATVLTTDSDGANHDGLTIAALEKTMEKLFAQGLIYPNFGGKNCTAICKIRKKIRTEERKIEKSTNGNGRVKKIEPCRKLAQKPRPTV